MKIVKRMNDELIEIKKVESIDNLDNSTLILLERGDKIKKSVKSGRTMFNNNNLYSVKSMKEAIQIYIEKQNKKNKREGFLCAVCGDWFPHNKLDEKTICFHCRLS